MASMKKISRNALVAGAAVAVVVGLGAAGAVAANGVLSPEEDSKAIIDDAASQLGVEPDELSGALKQAMKNRIDAAVDAGQLTEAQAKELKERIDSEDFPLVGRGPHGGPGFHGQGLGHFGHGDVLAAAASYLGLTAAELREQLDGKTLAEVAKAEGKSVSGLVDAMVAAAEKDIDQAVADGELTGAQATELKSGLDERMTDLVNGELERGPGLHHHGFGSMGDDHVERHGLFQGPPA
jgi:polyhydroxyalkanoate synthesis regulator phasin